MNNKLFNKLIEDENKSNDPLYKSGPMWSNQNKKIAFQLKKNGLKDFRGINSGVGSGYTDSILYDVRNEINIKGRIVSKFLSLPLINHLFNTQLKIFRGKIFQYLKLLDASFANNGRVNELINKYEFEKTTEFGCISKFKKNEKEYSCKYITTADTIDLISKKHDLNKIYKFFEIGGGFGSNIHFMLTNFKNIKKIIYLDVASNLFVGTEYLRNFYGNSVKDYLQLCDKSVIKFEENDSLEIICIPPWMIKNLEIEIDHFHNSHSFVEMPKKSVENYVKYINKFNTKEVSLVSYNRKTPHWEKPEDLNSLFQNKLEIEKYKTISMGYPINENVHLTGFIKN
tara:strand:+ start:8203 stop:9225 length:1023 start_codon:yes stop_codon:yes gene_type:complete